MTSLFASVKHRGVIRNNVFLLALVLIMQAATQESYAFSADHAYLSDQELVERSYDIVEGEVVHSSHVPASFLHQRCFSYLYKLKVSRSLKDSVKIGDVMNVGITRSSTKTKRKCLKPKPAKKLIF